MTYWAELMLLWSGQALLVIGAIVAVTLTLRRSSALDRYRLWLVGIAVISVLPAGNVLVRTLPVTPPPMEPTRYVVERPVSVEPATQSTAAVIVAPDRAPHVSTARPYPSFVTVLFAGWIGGALISMARPCRSYWQSRQLRAGATLAVTTSLRVPVGYSSQISAPMLVGIFHPMILLPGGISNWANAEEQRAMTLHEVAHFERNDHVVNLVQTLLEAVLFFHPAVRYALRQLVLERELACDELVLRAGGQPAAYAEALLKVAGRTIAGREGYEPAFHTAGKILERRMTMILNYRDGRATGSRILRAARVLAVIFVAMLVLPERVVTSGARLSVPVLVAAVPGLPAAQPFAVAQTVVAERASVLVTAVVTQAPAPAAAIGSLSGTIFDQTGAVIPGVFVQISSTGGANLSAVTDERGAYVFPQIAAGLYVLQARLPGFQTHRSDVVLRGQSDVADAVLPIAWTNTHVEVTTAAPQSPRTTLATGLPLRVGGVIAMPNLVSQPKPFYPAAPRARGIQGAVKLLGTVGTDGTIVSLQLDPSQGVNSMELVNAAMDAVRQWRYRPAMLNGQPIEVGVSITVNFSMQ